MQSRIQTLGTQCESTANAIQFSAPLRPERRGRLRQLFGNLPTIILKGTERSRRSWSRTQQVDAQGNRMKRI